MTSHEFMINAFYIMVGVVCAAVAVFVVIGAIKGIRSAIRGKSKE